MLGIRTAALLSSGLLLGACAGMKVEDYAAEHPPLVLEQYFNGTIDGYGMFQDRSGKVIKRFHLVIDAKWEGAQGTLDEHFSFSDGSKQRRVWTVTRLPGNRYEGRADDVIGKAEGVASGNALQWRYVLALPVDGKIYNVDLDDWMYLVDERHMLNRSVMRKFGFHLGDVTLSFSKRN